jgi:hypothetical protein
VSRRIASRCFARGSLTCSRAGWQGVDKGKGGSSCAL